MFPGRDRLAVRFDANWAPRLLRSSPTRASGDTAAALASSILGSPCCFRSMSYTAMPAVWLPGLTPLACPRIASARPVLSESTPANRLASSLRVKPPPSSMPASVPGCPVNRDPIDTRAASLSTPRFTICRAFSYCPVRIAKSRVRASDCLYAAFAFAGSALSPGVLAATASKSALTTGLPVLGMAGRGIGRGTGASPGLGGAS